VISAGERFQDLGGLFVSACMVIPVDSPCVNLGSGRLDLQSWKASSVMEVEFVGRRCFKAASSRPDFSDWSWDKIANPSTETTYILSPLRTRAVPVMTRLSSRKRP